MSLSIFSIDPQNLRIDTPIDSNVVIEFDQPVDPFTIENGISLYVLSEGMWTGPELSTLDSKFSDVLSVGNENTYFQYSYTLNADMTQVTLVPALGLLPNRKHFVQILPGNDATRYISARTYADPIYTRAAVSTGTISVKSAFIGKANENYVIDFSADATGAINTIDVVKSGTYLGSFKTVGDINLGDITVSFDGSFDVGDSIELDVFPASGVTEIYQTSFTTDEYNTVAVSSFKIESLDQLMTDPLTIVDIFPKNGSINNQKINPIVIKFNKPLAPNQDLTELLDLTKVSISSGEERKVGFIPVINGNVVKLYLNSVL